MKVSLVAAVARGGVIGHEGRLPWHLAEDLARFRDLTTGHPVVMGRRTWESLPDRFRPLPGRRNVVLTRNPAWSAQGAEHAGSLEDALRLVAGDEQVSIIGGGELFAAALAVADELLLTEIDLELEGDTFLPAWNRDAFVEVAREQHVAKDGTRFAFVTYRSAAAVQLAALADVHDLFERSSLDYWLFGGWAVDFHAGSITRPHSDVDIAVWDEDLSRIAALLVEEGWRHAPEPDENGGTGYERAGARLELTYLVRGENGGVATPLRDGEAPWPDGAFADDRRELRGVRARVLDLGALARGKSVPRDDPAEAAKDEADFDALSRVRSGR